MTHCFVTHSCGDVTRILDTENSNATLNKHGYSKCWFQNVHYKQLNNSAIVWVLLYKVYLPIVTTKPSQNEIETISQSFQVPERSKLQKDKKRIFLPKPVMYCNAL